MAFPRAVTSALRFRRATFTGAVRNLNDSSRRRSGWNHRCSSALSSAAALLKGPNSLNASWETGTATKYVSRDGQDDGNRSDELHVVTPRLRDAQVQRPKLEGNNIMVYSDNSNDFILVPKIWLRDNCQCSNCVHEVTKQRLLDTFAIPKDIGIEHCDRGEHGVYVTWSDGHKSYYGNELLAKSARKTDGTIRLGLTPITLWGSSIAEDPPAVQYDAVMSGNNGLEDWLCKIRRYGFSYVDGCPPTPEATEQLLKRIAFIRETHYGGFYDFTADLASADTAYTNIALEAHTDTTYFSDPAGLQMFHLLSHTEGQGGASLLVDGFAAAAELKKLYPEEYQVLSTVGIHAHASGNDGISIQPYKAFPVLLHDENSHQLIQVRWNNSDRAAIDMPIEEVEKWYKAADKWSQILRDPKFEYWSQMKPGQPLIFDNWRILHGRSAFTGKRRICGGYINRDDFISRFKTLNWSQEKVLRFLPTGA